jgi:hypothetical protein
MPSALLALYCTGAGPSNSLLARAARIVVDCCERGLACVQGVLTLDLLRPCAQELRVVRAIQNALQNAQLRTLQVSQHWVFARQRAE